MALKRKIYRSEKPLLKRLSKLNNLSQIRKIHKLLKRIDKSH